MAPPSKMELLIGMEDRMVSTLPTDVEDMFDSIIEKGNCDYLFVIDLFKKKMMWKNDFKKSDIILCEMKHSKPNLNQIQLLITKKSS